MRQEAERDRKETELTCGEDDKRVEQEEKWRKTKEALFDPDQEKDIKP